MITEVAGLLVSFLNWIGIKVKIKSFDLSDRADTLLYKYRSYMYSDIQSDEKRRSMLINLSLLPKALQMKVVKRIIEKML